MVGGSERSSPPLRRTARDDCKHALFKFYKDRNFTVVICSPLEIAEGEKLYGTETPSIDKVPSVVSIREEYGTRVVFLEEGEHKRPLLIYVGDLFSTAETLCTATGSEKEVETGTRASETLIGQATREATSKSLQLAATEFASWKEHPSRKVVHTGFKVKSVRSYCFAFSQGKEETCSCGSGNVVPVVRARSTLRENAALIYSGCINGVIRGAEEAFCALVPPAAVAEMQKASSRCDGRWMLGRQGTRSLFSSLGVNVQFEQNYHVDDDDAEGSLSCALYSVRGAAETTAVAAAAAATTPAGADADAAPGADADTLSYGNGKRKRKKTSERKRNSKRKRESEGTRVRKIGRGGQLVLPQLGAYLCPNDGDFVAWRTNYIVHGVAPCDKGKDWRTAFVLYQTNAVTRACLVCSE